MVSLKGAAVSASMKEEMIEALKDLNGYVPTLAIVRIGERPDDLSYERGATKKLEGIGLNVTSYSYPLDITNDEFCTEFAKINADDEIDGILLFRPLPKHINEKAIIDMIDPVKDLDGICMANMAKIFSGDKDGFAPCTAQAVVEILKHNRIELTGKRVAVVGRSLVIGKPVSMLLLQENATVTICHSKTENLPEVCRNADIVVAAIGRAKQITADYIGKDAVVIDVGINVDSEGNLCGDVDYDAISEIAGMATPVPGGVGGVTTSVLAKHLLQAAKIRRTTIEK